MKTKLFIAILLITATTTQAAILDVYEDGIIENGDVYDWLNIYDTPPDQTTISMTGGEVETFHLYNSSVLNFSAGDIGSLLLEDSSTLHMNGGTVGYISVDDLTATAHIYGYDFEYTPKEFEAGGWLTGFWENDMPFTIYFRGLPEQLPSSCVTLHEVPEPATLGILGFGFLLIKKVSKKSNS